MGTRRVICAENEPLALHIHEKREAFIRDEGYKENLDLTLAKVYRSICDSSDPIRSLRDASKLRGVGAWTLKLLKDFFVQQSDSDCIGPEEKEPTAKKHKTGKTYIPQRNSAPYAILLTLYRALESGSKFMLKQDLIDAAEASGLSKAPIQPAKCAGPSTLFGTTTKDWYSGWSSMKTLVARGLVVKSSCPAKYKLIEQGYITAEECLFRSGMTKVASKPLSTNVENCTAVAVLPSKTSSDATLSQAIITHQNTTLLEYNGQDSFDAVGPFEIRDDSSLEIAVDSTWSLEDTCDLVESGKLLAARSVDANCYSKVDEGGEIISNIENGSSIKHGYKMQGPTACNSFNSSQRTNYSNRLKLPPLGLGERFSEAYTVVMILDCREQFMHTDKGLSTKFKFAERLRLQYNIEVEIRHLPIGDTLWIARHKVTRQEYVLDFVVERKNVSDLLSSIRDTRYKQQKLHLMRCGLRKLIYLVEGDPNVMESAESIKTACFTTEIVEGFDVQRTRDIADTLRKYGALTNAIAQLYGEETGISDFSEHSLCKTFDDFLKHCSDLGKEKISDVFGVMLMQVKHVTEDIALSVLDKYPTPLSLAHAYMELDGDVAAQEQLLKQIPMRNQNRNISSTTSKNIFRFIWSAEAD